MRELISRNANISSSKKNVLWQTAGNDTKEAF